MLDAVLASEVRPESILLRDYSEINVRDGRELIGRRGLAAIARFDQADAFDRDDLAKVAPTPTVAVVSGLYELFGDNAMVSRSLAGIADAMPEGGCLVYTGQPWHPKTGTAATSAEGLRRSRNYGRALSPISANSQFGAAT